MTLDLSVQSGSAAASELSEPGETVGVRPPAPEPLLALDDYLGAPGDTEFRPDGDAGEFTGTATAPQTLAEYRVPVDRAAILTEVSLESDDNGTVRAQVAGTTFGDLSGSVALSLPFQHAKLTSGDVVIVTGESTSGSQTTVRGSITALLV